MVRDLTVSSLFLIMNTGVLYSKCCTKVKYSDLYETCEFLSERLFVNLCDQVLPNTRKLSVWLNIYLYWVWIHFSQCSIKETFKVAGTHICIDQETYRKIYKHGNGTPVHEMIGTSINQKENYRYRPRVHVKYQCSFLYYRGPKYNTREEILLLIMWTLPNHIQQR